MITDTSWLYALLNEADAHHDAAWQAAAGAAQIVTPGPVLAEFLQLVFWRARPQIGAKAAHERTRQSLADLEATPTWRLEPHYDAQSAASLYAEHRRLSYVDCVAVASARSLGLDLASFDEAQLAALR